MDPDVIIIGAGAAGLMCAAVAGKRGRSVIVLEHTGRIAEKIRISGGGRCNFTNLQCAPDKFLSANPQFCRSALSRYTQHDFIALVETHGIAYHEKTLGQLFCDTSATEIIEMLVKECRDAGVVIQTETTVEKVEREAGFKLGTSRGEMKCAALVVACGGLSIPKIGASGFGYEIARQFGLTIVPTRAGLVPLTFDPAILEMTKDLSGVAVDPVRIRAQSGKTFDEALLFTHRGISGPAVLQISSYWQPGEAVSLNLAPDETILTWLKNQRQAQAKSMVHTVLGTLLPKRLAQRLLEDLQIEARMADLPDKVLQNLAERIGSWQVRPAGSEGYRTAEVTLGGVATEELSSKTFEAKKMPGLYFIGEVVDVTGHLGGFNFQWAWSSGWCAGQYA